MTAPGQVITATPPAPPTAVSAVPAPPTSTVTLPTASINSIDGKRVPIIPPYVNAFFGGTATSSASFTASTAVAGGGSGLGALTVAVQSVQPIATGFGCTGSSTAAVIVGSGGTVVVPAAFATEGRLCASDAAYGAVCGLSAAVVPQITVPAAFYSTGTAIGILPFFADASFTTGGSTDVSVGQNAQWTGSGALSCARTLGLLPSGMTKTGTQSTPNTQNTWAQISGWSADTANYPGSVVTSDALVAQGTKASATVSTSVAWAAGSYGNSIQIKILKNGAPIATGTASSTSPATASATVPITMSDQITVQVCDTSMWASSSQATITAGAGTYVRMS